MKQAIHLTRSWLVLTLASTSLGGCDQDPAKGKTKVEAVAPVQETAPPSGATAVEYLISPETGSVEFTGAKVTQKHDGKFQKFDGKLHLVDSDAEKSHVMVNIDVGSLSIDPEKLQGHLLSSDFFDVEKFPTATFSSTKIVEKPGAGTTHEVTGNLEIRGVKKSITFPATIETKDGNVEVKAEFAINRKDFGIVYPGKPDDLIEDNVLIKLTLHPKKA